MNNFCSGNLDTGPGRIRTPLHRPSNCGDPGLGCHTLTPFFGSETSVALSLALLTCPRCGSECNSILTSTLMCSSTRTPSFISLSACAPSNCRHPPYFFRQSFSNGNISSFTCLYEHTDKCTSEGSCSSTSRSSGTT
jgi:hypothetical protein